MQWAKGLMWSAVLAMVGGIESSGQADVIVGGIMPQFGSYDVRRYSDTGTDLGSVGQDGFETFIEMTVDGSGNVYGAFDSLTVGVLWKWPSGGSFSNGTRPQYGSPSGIAVGWNGHLFVTSGSNGSSTLTGVLEIDETTGAFIRNAIPVSSGSLAFNADVAGIPGVQAAGLLYVGGSGNTARYRYLANGSITKDTTFSIANSGKMAFRHDDGSIYMGGFTPTITRYSATTGASLGTFATIPTGHVWDLASAPDNSLFVLGKPVTSPSAGIIYHYSATGDLLGSFAVPTLHLGAIAYVPEPGAMGMAAIGAAGLMLRGRRKEGMRFLNHACRTRLA